MSSYPKNCKPKPTPHPKGRNYQEEGKGTPRHTQHITSARHFLSGFLLLLPGIGEFQTNDIEDFLPLPTVIIFHKITELHLAVSLTSHINHINLFVRTWSKEMGSATSGLRDQRKFSLLSSPVPRMALHSTLLSSTLYVHVWEMG